MTIAGVNSITGYVISEPQAPPFEQQGRPVNPAHSNWGEKASPYPWEVVPMGPYPGKISPVDGIVEQEDSQWSIPAGYLSQDPTADQTPAYNAAPFPKEGPLLPSPDQMDVHGRKEGSIRQLLESASIHASNTGAGLKRLFLPQMLAKQDNWQLNYNAVSGEDLVPATPPQIGVAAFGFNVNDHVSNPYAKKNQYGLNQSHRYRRIATGSIPGNTLWLRARSRPLVRSLTGNYHFPVSGAFAGDDPGATFDINGAILTNTPTQYDTPPQVNLAPSLSDTSTVPEIPYY